MRSINKILIFICLILCLKGFSLETGSLGLIEEGYSADAEIGKQYLLLIAVNTYTQWLPLSNPVRDAKEIRDILLSRYYVDDVIELYDQHATKAGIIKTFSSLQEELLPEDSLLIFFAGHGHYDKKTKTGFWIPVNAGIDVYEQENWIANHLIHGFISNMRANHICLITDSCFSGDMLAISRGLAGPIENTYFNNAYSLVSRQVITSGALEFVPDSSSFCTMLKIVLSKNHDLYLDPMMIFNEIRLGITDTTPLYGSLKGSGHQEGASFLLFLKPEQETSIAGKTGKKEETDIYDIPAKEIETSFKNKYPGPDEQKEGEKEKPITFANSRFFSLSIGCGIPFPFGQITESIESGPFTQLSFRLNIRFPKVIFGIGLLLGLENLSTKEEVEHEYSMQAIPIALQTTCITNSLSPLYGFCDLTFGVSVTSISFLSAYDGLGGLNNWQGISCTMCRSRIFSNRLVWD